MRGEPGLRGQLTRTDLEPQYRQAIVMANTALTHVGRTLGEGSDEGENGSSSLAHACGCAAPFELKDVGVGVVGLGVGQRKSLVTMTPCLDMRPEMAFGLLGHPR